MRSSFESNCLSQEEMWHLMLGEGRGRDPLALAGPLLTPRGGQASPAPKTKLPQANLDGPLLSQN